VLHTGNNAVVVYEISTIGDRFGNELHHAYEHDRAAGDWWRTNISYAGGHAAIRFVYEARSDVITGWAGGLPVRTGQRLSLVQTLATSVLDVVATDAMATTTSSSGNTTYAASTTAAANTTAAPEATTATPAMRKGEGLVPLLTYKFSYVQSGLSGGSMLQSVRLCDGCVRSCMPPVTFE